MTTTRDPQSSSRRLLAGGTVLALAILVANAGNYALNLLLGRWLSPAEFSDANLMVTLMLTLTSIALCLQLVAARFVGLSEAAGHPDQADRLARTLRRRALAAGGVCAMVLAAGSPLWQELFQTASYWPFVILGLGMPCYLVQSVGRGVLQGRMQFRPLAVSFVVEMAVRLGVGVTLVAIGGGVNGATIGLAASFVATWLVVQLLSDVHHQAPGPQPAPAVVRRYASSVSVLLIGQIIANNSDVLVAKAAFVPTEAGIYSAVALVGRAVFFLSWSVATVVFPAVAQRHAAGHETTSLLRGGIIAVAAIGFACAVGALLVGGPILGVVLGPDYAHLSSPLGAYAGMTTLFAIANLVASHYLSQGVLSPSWMLLAGSGLQLGLILVWHASIAQLIQAQLFAMVILLLVMVAGIKIPSRRGQRPPKSTRTAVAP